MKAFSKTSGYDENNGMDLRDYFAANAPDMPSWFNRKEWQKQEVMKSVKDGENWYQPHTYTEREPMQDWFVRWRYEYADAMMKAREL